LTNSLGQASFNTIMTIHVNIGEAKTRLSELVAAALRGDDVVLDKAGEPKVRLVPVEEALAQSREAIARRRREIFERGAIKYAHLQGSDATIVPPSMTEEEIDAREARIGGPAD
jgi:prevent-host-death family protein